jgi:hypothetical protein
MRRIPWFEAFLIVGLGVALIVKPQTKLLSAPAGDAPASRARTYVGEMVAIGDGTARSWVRTGTDGQPVALGITLSEDALSSLPQTDPAAHEGQEYLLRLPAQVSVAPFDHLTLNWTSVGHEPKGVYDTPHFDFHFYLISQSTRRQIRAGSRAVARAPDADHLPDDYIRGRVGIANVGLPWIDRTAPELHGQPFTATLLYGSYDGQLAFVEPMVAKDFLQSRASFSAAVKLPRIWPAGGSAGGYVPTSYRVAYDPVAKEYSVWLEGLSRR